MAVRRGGSALIPAGSSPVREPVEYRGFEIDADKNSDGEWITTVDGDEIAGHERSFSDAIRRGKIHVNRKIGKPKSERKTVVSDDSYFDRLREIIGSDS